MSLEHHWTCDGCGRREILACYGLPSGWIIVRGREIAHCCPECAPPAARSSLARRLWRWCQWHPSLAAMILSNLLLLVVLALSTAFSALRFRRYQEQIEQLERAHASGPLHAPSPTPLRP